MEKPLRPTDAELAILRVLWQRGPSTVKDVHKVLDATKKTGYTTVLKFMQIMVEKGLVSRDESPFAHIYQARVPRRRRSKPWWPTCSSARSKVPPAGWSCRRWPRKKQPRRNWPKSAKS